MAAAEAGVCPLPAPPVQYYQHYTDENVKNCTAPKPPPIVEGIYSMFGAQLQTDEEIIRPLEAQGLSRLYPPNGNFDRITELKKLNHSILMNFLELLDILTKCPSSTKREKKLNDISLLFINMHHLINELRPHQARETLRVMLERQKQQRLETADNLQRHIDRVLQMLQGSANNLQELIHSSFADKQDGTQDMEVDQNQSEDLCDHKKKQEKSMCSLLDE